MQSIHSLPDSADPCRRNSNFCLIRKLAFSKLWLIEKNLCRFGIDYNFVSAAVYTVNIPEDVPRGSTILAPVSSDRDASTNKELRFSITKGNNMVYQL